MQLSYNNTYDLDAAWRIVGRLRGAHGARSSSTATPAAWPAATIWRRRSAARWPAIRSPRSAAPSAVNRTVDEATAEEIAQVFFEDLIAPASHAEALAILSKKRDLRVMRTGGLLPATGALEQGRRRPRLQAGRRRLPGPDPRRAPRERADPRRRDDAPADAGGADEPALRLARGEARALATRSCSPRSWRWSGVGAGQMSRVDSVDLACRKAGDRAVGSVMASDAFFPFPDGIERAAEAGVTAVIQPAARSATRPGHRGRQPPPHGDDLHAPAALPALRRPTGGGRAASSAPPLLAVRLHQPQVSRAELVEARVGGGRGRRQRVRGNTLAALGRFTV